MLRVPALLALVLIGALVVVRAYAAPVDDVRPELGPDNVKVDDEPEEEDEPVDKRRFRGVKKRVFPHEEESEEASEKRDDDRHPKHQDVERVLKDTGRVKSALKELMSAMRELDHRAAEHKSDQKPQQKERKSPDTTPAAAAAEPAQAKSGPAAAATVTGAVEVKPTREQVESEGASAGARTSSDKRKESVVDEVSRMAKRSENRRSSINVPYRWG